MSNLHNLPTRDNTVMKEEQINVKPIYVNKMQAAKMVGISKSTLYRWITEAEESGEWTGLSIRPSATVTLIHLSTLEAFLKFKDKSFL